MDIQHYIDEYISWLKSEITFSKVGDYYEINTPFWILPMTICNFISSKKGLKSFLRMMVIH